MLTYFAKPSEMHFSVEYSATDPNSSQVECDQDSGGVVKTPYLNTPPGLVINTRASLHT